MPHISKKRTTQLRTVLMNRIKKKKKEKKEVTQMVENDIVYTGSLYNCTDLYETWRDRLRNARKFIYIRTVHIFSKYNNTIQNTQPPPYYERV